MDPFLSAQFISRNGTIAKVSGKISGTPFKEAWCKIHNSVSFQVNEGLKYCIQSQFHYFFKKG
jgi:hypothetical protein